MSSTHGVRITVMFSFQEVGIEGYSTVYRGVLISGGWNRGVPLYTEVSSFQLVRIERGVSVVTVLS